MSHQQARAHVTAQAAQLQPIPTTHHHVPPPMPDHNVTMMAPELSKSSSHIYSHPPLVAADKPEVNTLEVITNAHIKVVLLRKRLSGGVDGLVTEIIYKGKHNHQPPRTVGNLNEIEPFNDQTSDFNYSEGKLIDKKGSRIFQ